MARATDPIICPRCNSPRVSTVVVGRGRYFEACKACGHESVLGDPFRGGGSVTMRSFSEEDREPPDPRQDQQAAKH